MESTLLQYQEKHNINLYIHKSKNLNASFSALGNPETNGFDDLHHSSTPNKNVTSNVTLSNGLIKHASIESIPRAEVLDKSENTERNV